MSTASELALLREQLAIQAQHLQRLEHALGILQDREEIRRLQYCYGYFMDNRMFREMTDLFADCGAHMEIGGRGRYQGKERIHAFLLEVLGEGRWGLLKDEVINHVQQQLLITVDADRQHAHARARAQIQGNSPPTTPTFLFADGVYENTYVREDGRCRRKGPASPSSKRSAGNSVPGISAIRSAIANCRFRLRRRCLRRAIHADERSTMAACLNHSRCH
jgi:hypothetical protein